MSFFYICLRVSAMSFGVALIVAQIRQNMEYLGEVDPLSGIGLAVIAVPFATAIAVVVMDHARCQRRYGFAAVALITILCGVGHTFGIALERGVQARETGIAARVGKNVPYDLAKKSHDAALVRVTEMEAAETASCRTTGKVCSAARESLAQARSWAEAKKGELVRVGVPIEIDGMAYRYGPIAAIYDTWHPLLLPLAQELLGLVLFGCACWRDAQHNVQSAAMTQSLSKVDEAEVEVRRLKAQLGSLPPVREVAAQIGHSTTTTHRALRRVG